MCLFHTVCIFYVPVIPHMNYQIVRSCGLKVVERTQTKNREADKVCCMWQIVECLFKAYASDTIQKWTLQIYFFEILNTIKLK